MGVFSDFGDDVFWFKVFFWYDYCFWFLWGVGVFNVNWYLVLNCWN